MSELSEHDSNFIGGSWVQSSSGERIPVEDPSTAEVIASVPNSDTRDVEMAVAAAADALERWSGAASSDRARLLFALADALAARQEELARLICVDVGTVYRTAKAIQAALPVTDLRTCAALLETFEFEERIGNSRVFREPIGVVAAITPWNYPLHQMTAKIAPALAAGCTLVLKPSEVAPLSAYALGHAAEQVELPPGVLNIVFGTGPQAGECLVDHPNVEMISFTGSPRAGRRVGELAARTIKRVVLELGGKSANVILPGADLKTAVKVGVANAFLNQGQTCSAWTRMLAPADSYEECAQLAATFANSYVAGPPLDPATRLGPVVSAVQRERVLGYIEAGERGGATLLAGGGERPAGVDAGHYVRPTVFGDVSSDMAIAQEEIFGPVLSILAYSDADDALRIANDSVYGLSGAVWSDDERAAIEFARRMRTGQVDVNGGAFNPLAPFGGYRQSGNGRELGRYGIEEYLQPKAVQL